MEKQNTGVLVKNGDLVTLEVEGMSSAAIQLDSAGTLVGTVTFKGSIDGKTYFNIKATDMVTGTAAATETTFPAYKKLPCAGLKAIQVVVTAYTSGSSNVFMKATQSTFA